MTQAGSHIDTTWTDNQITRYKELLPSYEKYAELLQVLLQKVASEFDSLSIVQTRPKSIASFAEKIIRKWPKYNDPVNQFTDLCGGRIITHTQRQVQEISQSIEECFLIDWDNSIDVRQRLKPTEFGYRSVHYIVQVKRDGLFSDRIDEEVLQEILGLKAEIQVRTILEHAWANLYHEWGYKNEFEIPLKLEREMAGLSARLEAADNSFSGVQEELKEYYTSYGAYMNPDQMHSEMEKLEITLKYDPENLTVLKQIGKLALALEEWDRAIHLLSGHENKNDNGLLRILGIALCKKQGASPDNPDYLRGQELLLKAGSPPDSDPDALSSLADTWTGIDEAKASVYYLKAYELDPSDAYALGKYLECVLLKENKITAISLIVPNIHKAIQRSERHINVGVNLPWAHYDIGKLRLLSGQAYPAFSAYAKAIGLSSSSHMTESSFLSYKRLEGIREDQEAYLWIENLFLLSLAVTHNVTSASKKISRRAQTIRQVTKTPVVILAGGTKPEIDSRVGRYSPLVQKAFKEFKGTVISGGTTTGISRICGDLKEKYPEQIYTLGYVPESTSTEVDGNSNRYNEIRRTKAEQFSPLEATQYWLDLIASGVRPENVSLLVIHGGEISVAECKLALTLGARVGIVEDSGGETARLFSDSEWNSSKGLIMLPEDSDIIRIFINQGKTDTEKEWQEHVAKKIHEAYRKEILSIQGSSDPSLASWEDLIDSLKDSNRSQSRHIFEKLRHVGYEVRKVKTAKIELVDFPDHKIERMARLEHARWVVERLSDGWKYAEKKDVVNKLSPYLVSWEHLSEDIRHLDRKTVKKIPQFLAEVGLELCLIEENTNE